ncbi:MAG: BMP family ABC transporter substrate-binding protein, partial [Firmicutes bacterium]|nr:BMP family ABC transporter substrate-binding protein [Bacillota bacterium]
LIECKGDNFRIHMTEAASSHEMVICVGRQFWEIGDVSREYSGVKFVWMDNTVENPENYPNLENVVFNENQGAYLAGYIAAAMTETGVIGIVASEVNSITLRYAAGFIQGARSVNSSVDIVTTIAGTGNTGGGLLPARAAIEKDADVLLEIGFGTSAGVYQAAREADVRVIGSDIDKKIAFPGYDDLILCSVKKDIGRAIVKVVTKYDDYGQFSGGKTIAVGVNEGYVDICYGNEKSVQLVDENLVTQIQYLRDNIINQVITVSTGTKAFEQAIQVDEPVGEAVSGDETGDGDPQDGHTVPDN